MKRGEWNETVVKWFSANSKDLKGLYPSDRKYFLRNNKNNPIPTLNKIIHADGRTSASEAHPSPVTTTVVQTDKFLELYNTGNL